MRRLKCFKMFYVEKIYPPKNYRKLGTIDILSTAKNQTVSAPSDISSFQTSPP